MSGLWPLGLAAGAGFATVSSPCVLPILPLLLGATQAGISKARPLWIIVGFVGSFAGVGWAFAAATQVLGVDAGQLRQGAALVMLGAGLVMVVPSWGDRLARRLSGVAGWAGRLGAGLSTTPLSSLLLGASLGVLWTPCAGPVLASMLALLARADARDGAVPLLLAYAIGAGVPMLAIAYGGQWLVDRVRRVARHAGGIRRALGVMVMATAGASWWGLDTWAAAWLSGLASEDRVTASTAAGWADRAAKVGDQAPALEGVTAWLNRHAAAAERLEGKVVLVDFWTFGCINCIRTLPHLQRLHERYAAHGLVVVGVHTPEFAHERSLPALRAAVARHGLTYPIAQDNGWRVWEAFRNPYWPAQYLIDPQGRIVFRHFGEGGAAAIEQAVQRALGIPSPSDRR